jgi:hypothetical protein
MLKKFFTNLFKQSSKDFQSNSNIIVVQLNDKIQPIDRGEIYEDPLNEFLTKKQYGEIIAAGTMLEKSGELASCDITIELFSNKEEKKIAAEIIEKLEKIGVPKSSKLKIERTKVEIEFGTLEGLAIYLDGINLPDEVYQDTDPMFVINEIRRLANIQNNVIREWRGHAETGLYFYGKSFQEMRDSISDLIHTYPLCRGAKVVQIA